MMRAHNEQETTRTVTEGNPFRLILLFSLPLMAGNVFQQMYTVVDTAVVGKILGVDTLAALGAADWLNWFILSMVQGFAQGFAILMAQQFGAADHGGLRRTVANSIILAVLISLVVTASAELLISPVLNLLNTPEEIQPVSKLYLSVLFAGTPIVMTYNLCAGVLRSLGDSSTPLYAMILASLINIGLDILFVAVIGTGVAGAAAATLLAQLISAIYCIRKLTGIEILRMKREEFRVNRRRMMRLMTLGAPMAFQNSIIAVGGMIVQTVVNTMGIAFIAGFTATNKLYGLLEAAGIAYGFAMVTYTGQNLGAGKRDRISAGTRAGLVVGIGTSLVISAVMFLFGNHILGLFISTDTENGREALATAFHYLKIMSSFLPVLYVLHIMRSCIQGLGNTVLPMVSGIAEFVMRTGATMILPGLFGQNGILFAEVLAWFGADLILVPSYFHVMKQMRRIQNKD